MFNIIRADIFRILRGKGIYILLAVVLAWTLLNVATLPGLKKYKDSLAAPETPIVSEDYTESQELAASEESVYDAFGGAVPIDLELNGISMAKMLLRTPYILIYGALALLIFAAAPMFTHGTVKNSLARGMSRVKLYVSKLILCSVLCVILMLLYILLGTLLATFIWGFGTPPDGFWLSVLKIFSSQFVLLLALICFGLFLVFAFRRTAIVIGVYISLMLVPSIIAALVMNVNSDLGKTLWEFDFYTNITRLGMMGTQEPDFFKIFASAALFIVVPTLVGMLRFRNAEIK